MAERPLPFEIETDGATIHAMAFSASGEDLVACTNDGIQVWRLKDGGLVVTLDDYCKFHCIAASQDGKWIVAGGQSGSVIVLDASTYEIVFRGRFDIRGADFSPDSNRFVAASWGDVHILNLPNCEKVQTIEGSYGVKEAKYSPRGDRIATASRDTVQIWDSDNGHLLREIPVEVASRHNNGLLWLNNQKLFVVSGNIIRQFDTSTGSAISEWPVPDARWSSSIALSHCGKFLAYATHDTVSLWDTSTQVQLIVDDYPDAHISSIAFSPNDKLFAISQYRKLCVKSLPRIIESILLSRLHPTLQEPDIQIDGDLLKLWEDGQLETVEALLTESILKSSEANHHLLGNRAILHTRLEQWDAALVDAKMSIMIQPSIIAYIAKSIAHVGLGEKHKAYQACDMALEQFHWTHDTFIRLIKAIIVFMAGEQQEAMSRLDDLIAAVPFHSTCYVVRGYMHTLLGTSRRLHENYEGAICSFEDARAQLQHYKCRNFTLVPLAFGWKLNEIDVILRRCLCDALYTVGRVKDAVECFHKMVPECVSDSSVHREHREWVIEFSKRAGENLETLGDIALEGERYDEAVSHYTVCLSLDPRHPERLISKRKKAFAAVGSWEHALDEANKVIPLSASSPWGYELKYAALHKKGDYVGAADVFELMLSKIAQSPNPDIRQYGDKFVTPSSTRAAIRKITRRTIRHIPRVLINTKTGRLYDKTEHTASFESSPTFNRLVSSMTTRIDYASIRHEVRQYFRYVMLSHKWEDDEPLFQQMRTISVWDLGDSPTHNKLQTFCMLAREAGFTWAWSDTCCINKSDHFVLQEALVAMFRWYRDSALVIVFLRGVYRSSRSGALVASAWNTRAWTLQEYIAAKVVRFYTEDWTLYLDLQMPNHKEAPEVISEMEQATGVSAEELRALRPGLTSIREKLRLASSRHTTLVEDAAYSLLGIFSASGIPAIYGEGDGSLGRLLAHIVTVSGDASTLAWSGESGSFNSCLPAHISVFNGPSTSHLPPSVPEDEMEKLLTASETCSLDLDTVLKLYDRLSELPAPWFAASRMKLPCIAFQLPPLASHRTGRVYRVNTLTFGMVEIKTRHDLSRMKPLFLVHPWLDTVLDRGGLVRGTTIDDDVAPQFSPDSDDEDVFEEESQVDLEEFSEPEMLPLPAPSQTATDADRALRARRLAARLRQPFGALLLTPANKGRIGIDYRRVAADSVITVRYQESVSLVDILNNVHTFDVL